jgi:uncharacterized protein
MNIKNISYTFILLIFSNIFMTFAWYSHLKNLKNAPLIMVIFISWGIAFFEYILQVPANRIGHTIFSVSQLKIIQEFIALSIFIPFSIFYMKEKISFNYIIASFFMLVALYFALKK